MEDARRRALDEGKYLRRMEVDHVFALEKASRAQERMQSPSRFGRHMSSSGAHLQVWIKHTSQYFEIFAKVHGAM